MKAGLDKRLAPLEMSGNLYLYMTLGICLYIAGLWVIEPYQIISPDRAPMVPLSVLGFFSIGLALLFKRERPKISRCLSLFGICIGAFTLLNYWIPLGLEQASLIEAYKEVLVDQTNFPGMPSPQTSTALIFLGLGAIGISFSDVGARKLGSFVVLPAIFIGLLGLTGAVFSANLVFLKNLPIHNSLSFESSLCIFLLGLAICHRSKVGAFKILSQESSISRFARGCIAIFLLPIFFLFVTEHFLGSEFEKSFLLLLITTIAFTSWVIIFNSLSKIQEEQDRANEHEKAVIGANERRRDFVSSVSHEICTPLNTIIGFCELATEIRKEDSELQEYLGHIDRNTNYVLNLMNDLLDAGKIEAGQMTFNKSDFLLAPFLQDIEVAYKIRAASKGIEFTMGIDSSCKDLITTDRTRFRQVIENLLSNAFKFTNEGEIKVYISQSQDVLSVAVKDSGVGISSDERKRIFHPFSQANESINKNFGGSGLGMYISRQICVGLGGDLVLVSSLIGEGSHFRASVRV